MIPGFWPALVVAIIIAAAVVAATGRRQSKGRAATRPKQEFTNRFYHRIERPQKSQEGAADLRPLGREDF
jgi:hypothetical protein